MKLSYEEYLALERETDLRHELLDGEARAMGGGTILHSAIKSNLTALFHSALRGRPCRPYDADMKVHVEETGLFTYPDLSVICGPPIRSKVDRDAATNPILLAEVLSRTSEGWDRGGKFAHYRRSPSLKHYLLVSTDTVRVEIYTREEDGRWVLSEHGAGEQVEIPALGVALSVDELYADLPEEEEEEAEG